MIKDVNGSLWIGTGNGLNRFDGRKFKIFFHDPGNPSTICGGGILGLVEDSLHNIWVGTNGGLSRYDIRADTFTNFISSANNALLNAIQPLWSTRNEVYCLEQLGQSDLQITMYNVHSFKKKNLLKLAPSDKANVRYSLFDIATNSVWMLYGEGLETGLLQISLTDGTKKNYSWPTYKNFPNPSPTAPSMCYDKRRNSFWINSSDGLIQFTLTDKKFHHIDVFNDWVNMKDYNPLSGMAIDKEGRVWLFIHPKGIIIYDPSDESVKLPFNNHPDLQKEVSDEIQYLYIDKEDIAWTGYWSNKGFYQLIPNSTVVTRYAADTVKLWTNTVANLINADHGRLWLGTSQGLQAFDPHTGLFQVILTEKDLPGVKGSGIFPLAIDTLHRKAWFLCRPEITSQFGSLYEMDVSTKKCRPVIFKDSVNHIIPSADILIIPYFMHFNNTRFKNGCIVLARYNNQQCIFLVNAENPVAKQILALPEVTINPWFSTDGEHFLFMISNHGSVNFSFTDLSGKWMRTSTPFDSIKWNRVVYNKSDLSYWVVAFQQLMHYDKSFRLIKRYTLKDGLPEFEIYGLGPDNNGNIWFNTDRSIYQLNIQTGKITVLSEKDGFLRQSFTMGDMSRVKDEKGDIYFPAGFFGNGFDKISPDKFLSPPSFVYAQSIEINQTPVSLSTGINNIEKLSLRYFQNNINIATGIIDYYSKGEGRIRYRLEGLDTNWQYGPDYYTIRYERLPPAKYKLVMQASNSANEFNGPEKFILINISPAFWNTWWFRILAAICIIALIYGFMRWRIQQRFRVQLKNSEKERQVAELKQKATELEMQALRAQMNPHFIFNSLNSINRFILQNDRAQASEYLTKFSKLVRMILQNSQASLITLESELESLELYLNLESLRFNYHFDYKISVPKDLDISALQVPPLILQPYVENAIWHGLMHKEERGQLDVEVMEEDDHLYFKITDNGIGREKAAALSSKSATRHKSMGLRITAHRIAIIQNSQPLESPVTINDLVNADGNASGTEVVIKMPVVYD